MNKKAGITLALALTLMLAGCDQPPSKQVSSGEGRTRLSANQSYGEFGEYVVHVSAMTSNSLTPDIAQSYGITRSGNVGLINLVVLEKTDTPGADQPVRARVEVTAANLTGQVKGMTVREIEDGPSIYYIGEVSVDNRETINFDFDVRPDGSNRVLPVRFTHEFYTE